MLQSYATGFSIPAEAFLTGFCKATVTEQYTKHCYVKVNTSYSLKGTTIPNAHTIQKGLYARNSSSVCLFAGELASHLGF